MKTRLLFLAFIFFGSKSSAQLVTEYTFDNSVNNTSGAEPFTKNTGVSTNLSFVADRHGNANSALYVQAADATITNLPIGNSARSISIWVKASNLASATVPIFSYGVGSLNSSCGLGVYPRVSGFGTYYDLYWYGYGNDVIWQNPGLSSAWNHYVVTYSGSTGVAAIYLNGVLQSFATKTGWNTTDTVFRLGMNTVGGIGFFGYIDDLKIYNTALTQAQITSLYNNNNIILTPVITSISTSGTSASETTINYTLNANASATTSVINYGTSAGALTNQVTAGSASGALGTAVSGVLTGLTLGTTYYYQIVATNSLGSTTSTTRSFIHADISTAVAEYNFDNTLNNIYGSNPFVGSSTLSFVNDRNGNPLSAVGIPVWAGATIANLPIGNAARTVSLWVLQPTTSVDNHVFRYGSLNINNASYGLANQSINLNNFGWANDLVATGQAASGASWVHVVTTFDGTTAKLYRNGTLLASGNKSGWNTTSTDFYLGSNTQIYIDDLKVYDRAITASEVTSLYSDNTLSTTYFSKNNLQASIYPNPTNDILNIETDTEIKSVEIYNLLGQKIKSDNQKQVNVSNLASGTYMVKIHNVNNEVVTKKIVKQ